MYYEIYFLNLILEKLIELIVERHVPILRMLGDREDI